MLHACATVGANAPSLSEKLNDSAGRSILEDELALELLGDDST